MKEKKHKEFDPLAIEVTNLFMKALQHKPILPITAFCLDLARSALGWELAGNNVMARKEIRKAFNKIPA